MKNSSETSREQVSAESWDMSNAPAFLGDSKETTLSEVKSEMKFWANEYNTVEMQFADYVKNGRSGDYCETLKKYEDDIKFNWSHLQQSTNKAWESQLIRSDYELADTQRLGVIKPEETVEAATGIFYEKRAQELNEKILSKEQGGEDTQADHAILRQTWRKVLDYIEAASDYESLHRNYTAYHNMRRSCHNHMIQQLNDLNHLAEKYNTERFTARDFMTNDFHYESRRDKNGSLNHRADYDRETVLAYFRTAFQKDFDGSEKKARIKERGMTSGITYYD